MEKYLAHIRRDDFDQIIAVQPVSQHCRNAAAHSSAALEPVSLSASGYLAGLVHDLGKYTEVFLSYIRDRIGRRGSVNHTFAGVRLLLERYHNADAGAFADVVSELLALAAGEHHNLFDIMDRDKGNGFQYRLDKEGIDYETAAANFYRFCAGPEELDRYFQAAREELSSVLEHIRSMTGEEASQERYEEETAFYCGLLARLLLSAVIEGDRRDTAEFMRDAQFPPKRDGQELEQLWGQCLDRVEEKLDRLPQTSPIAKARRAISAQCRQAAEQPGGVYRLNVPTGGGKTLSALRFALAHAKRHRKQRIIFTSPLLSILDQNSKEIRKYVDDDSLILEHHSNLIRIDEDPEEWDQRELLTETWGAPIIITTLVQLLNTLFSGKTTAIRRFHALCGSVIIMDEVQTVPSKLLSLFSLAVNFLANICGATVVLCSATQPCIEQIKHPLRTPIPDLVPYSPELWTVFRRTDIQSVGTMTLEGIAQFALERMETVDSLLIVCNKKAQSEQLFRLLQGRDFSLFHLSASMCVQHRRNTLDELYAALDQKRKVICVSTQVIEAGIDISFACVIRLTAGMDSVVQAAGRCNRSGEAGPGVLAPVYLIQCQGETLDKLPDIQWGQEATGALLQEFKLHPEQYQGRLDSDPSISCYYRTLYKRMPLNHHDGVWKKGCPSLFSLLSRNSSVEQDAPYYFRQAFQLAGREFQVFEENTSDVIVPYGKGAELIADLCSKQAEHDIAYLKEKLEQAKSYTISLYQWQIDRLMAEHALIPLQGGGLGLSGHYNEQTGFFVNKSDLDFLGV